MDFKEKKIPIESLSLWDENARFPDQYYNSNQKELIQYFLSKPNFKIRDLIEEIVLDSDLPHLEKVVVWDTSDNLIVIEGNRRLTGYKLLANPEIIADSDQKLYKYLIEKQSGHGITNNFTLDCLISKDKDKCYRYIDRKHAKGNNQVNWLEPERVNYSKRRGVENQNAKLKIAITNYVRKFDIPEDVKNEILGQGYVTTFFRLVATGPAKETYGLTTDENGELKFDDPSFPEKLKVIIHDVLKKEDFEGKRVDSRELNKNQQIEDYLKNVKAEHAEKVDKEIKINTQKDIFGKESTSLVKLGITPQNTTTRRTPRTKENETLFGKTLTLKGGKVNDLYRAILGVYEKSHYDTTVLPIIGMSLRLITEVAARVYFNENAPKKANKDQIYNDFKNCKK